MTTPETDRADNLIFDDPQKPASVLDIPDQLKPRYDRLVFVDNHTQAERLCEEHQGTGLLVTSNWLTWRKLTDRGLHCLHFEAMLGQWTAVRGNPEKIVMQANAWHFREAEDVTLYKGVSLGNSFSRHMTYLYNAYHRLASSLQDLIKTYQPKELVYYGLRVESDILDHEIIETLLLDLADSHSCRLVIEPQASDLSPSPYPVGRFLETSSSARKPSQATVRHCLREGYLTFVDKLFALRFFATRKKPQIFLFLNWLAVRNIIGEFGHDTVTPVLIAEPWPKSFHFLWTCLRKGVLLTRLPVTTLDSDDLLKIEAIIARLEDLWSDRDNPFQQAQKHFVRKYYLGNKLINERALAIKKYHMLLDPKKIKRAVIGDSENWICSAILETAHDNGIPSDELLNGIFLSSQQTPNRNIGTGDRLPPLDRVLSWGRVNDDWLRSIHSPLASVQTGYPTVDARDLDTPLTLGNRRNALLLPVIPSGDDSAALYSHSFSFLVTTARLLAALGYDQLRLKIHPGHISTKAYFEEVLDYHNIDCQVIAEGPLSVHTDWADIVVGPVNSGSHVEVLAQGKPYYPCQTMPSSLNSDLFSQVPTFDSVDKLAQAIRTGYVPDRKRILEYFCSSQSIPNASRRFWDVMNVPEPDKSG